MPISDFAAVIDLERDVKVGDTIRARFTNSGHEWEFLGIVMKLNTKSVRVRALPGEQPYIKAGYAGENPDREFIIERWGSPRWSWRNGIFPVEVVE